MMHDEAAALDEHFGALDDHEFDEEDLIGEEDDENLDEDEGAYLEDDEAAGMGFEAAPDAGPSDPEPTPLQPNGTVSTYASTAEVGECVGLARVRAEVRGLRQAVAAADESVAATNRTANTRATEQPPAFRGSPSISPHCNLRLR